MTRAWDKEISESSTGIEPMTSVALSTELRELMESKVILTVFIFDRGPAYC